MNAIPASIKVAVATAALVTAFSVFLLVAALTSGRVAPVVVAAAWLGALAWFIRATMRGERRARAIALPVAIGLGAAFLGLLATKLFLVVRDGRGDPGETLAILLAAVPFVVFSAALARRSAAAWFEQAGAGPPKSR